MEHLQTATIRPAYAIADSQSALLRSVFAWMTIGLLITGGVAYYVLGTPGLAQSLLSGGRLFGLIIAEIFLVIFLSVRVNRMSSFTATSCFLAYSALNGITLVPFALYYTGQSITSAFVVTAGTFAGMAFYGFVTKRDLSGLGSFLMMGLFGIVLASIVMFFVQSDAMMFAINVAGVIVFTGLTAHEVQQIKHMGSNISMSSDGEVALRRAAIAGALALYLNFINLFVSILRLMGNRN